MNVNILKYVKNKKAPSQDEYQSVCGLDALYFYIKVDKVDYTDFYINHLLNHHIEGENFVLLSPDYKKQFTYFQHLGEIEKNKNNNFPEGFCPIQEICRIGFKNLNSSITISFFVYFPGVSAAAVCKCQNTCTRFYII